jgi:hypothetical protein
MTRSALWPCMSTAGAAASNSGPARAGWPAPPPPCPEDLETANKAAPALAFLFSKFLRRRHAPSATLATQIFVGPVPHGRADEHAGKGTGLVGLDAGQCGMRRVAIVCPCRPEAQRLRAVSSAPCPVRAFPQGAGDFGCDPVQGFDGIWRTARRGKNFPVGRRAVMPHRKVAWTMSILMQVKVRRVAALHKVPNA